MPEPVVNASPLIYLARGGCFDLLRIAGAKIMVPASVARELRQRGPNDPAVEAMDQAPWISMVPDPPISRAIQAWNLGAGESAVLAYAQAHPGAEALMDDLAGRRCAVAIGVPVRGTLGIVLAAKQQGVLPLARPVVERMRQSGMYLSDNVMNSALAIVGE